MIIHKQGTAPSPSLPEVPWWVGTKLLCKACGTELELEAGDAGQVFTASPQSGVDRLCVDCPTCGQLIAYGRDLSGL